MVLPFTLPDWVPWWLVLPGIIVALFLALAYLAMPFAVFGMKARLATMEARLDEIQGEIRSLSFRLPEPHAAEYDPYEEAPSERGRTSRPDMVPQRRPVIVRPPIPPRAEDDEPPFAPPRGLRRPAAEERAPRPRTEPRFGPPR